MKNVYDIRREKQLQFIFSTEHSLYIPEYEELGFVAVVVNLYYEDKVKKYSQYLNNLPDGIAIYIFSSREETLEEARKSVRHKKTFFEMKKNRGRDISALLVSFSPYMENYKYICFLHDKTENYPWFAADVEKWDENLWSNMVASSAYICNVLELFKTHLEVGILFPPEPVGECLTSWYRPSWSDNFENCVELAQRMHLSADIRVDKPPIALGSVFWARREVLEKLFRMNWKYEDFHEEPMPLDFTISHAIERIFGYLAQDAGYEAGTVMTEQYASWLLLFAQDHFRQMFLELSKRMEIDNLRQFSVLNGQKDRVLQYYKEHDRVFLYGAGKCGRALLKLMREEGLEPAGFLVTDGEKTQDVVEGLKVFEISSLDLKKKGIGIIVTSYYYLQDEMLHKLKECGICDYMILYPREWEEGENH